MTHLKILVLALLLLVIGAAIMTPAGRAQSTPSARFAFADTTLLRDTLGLQFGSLLRLADSLGVLPDSLRAWSVRYLHNPERLVFLADSLRLPIDSVGPRIERERSNPLASNVERANDFSYRSSYNIQQTSSSWTNGSDYNLVLGPVYVRNVTSVLMDRYRFGGRTSLRQTRSADTEAGWKFSPDLSLGGRVNLDRFNSSNSGGVPGEAETKNEYQFSFHGRRAPSETWNSDIDFFSGLLDLRNSRQLKRGVTGNLHGSAHFVAGKWLTHDFDGQVSGNLARTRATGISILENTRDASTNLHGTLGMFAGSPLPLNLNYDLRRSRVQTVVPLVTTFRDTSRDTTIRTVSVQTEDVHTDDSGVDLSTQLRRDASRYISFSGRLDRTRQATASSLESQNSRDGGGFNTIGNYVLAGWEWSGKLSLDRGISQFPHRDTTGGYTERVHARSVETTLSRNLGSKVVLKATGGVRLESYRYSIIDRYAAPPVARDQYRQSYRIDCLYNRSIKSSTSVALEVARSLFVNIPSASTAANNEDRTYSAEWRWSYRLLSGLTANQRNQLIADYVYYTFLPANNRLTMDYSTVTTLNATVTPRLRLDVTHNARFQPSGNYRPIDGTVPYFSKADESRNYTLSTAISYQPTAGISITLQDDYFASGRDGTLNGQVVPQRDSRTMNFSGGLNLNLPLGPKGRLSGDIRRSYRDDRSTGYVSGQPQYTPRSQTDYWNGRLDLSWNL